MSIIKRLLKNKEITINEAYSILSNTIDKDDFLKKIQSFLDNNYITGEEAYDIIAEFIEQEKAKQLIVFPTDKAFRGTHFIPQNTSPNISPYIDKPVTTPTNPCDPGYPYITSDVNCQNKYEKII